MFSRSVNDTSRVVRMTIIDNATTWSVNSDNFKGVTYDHNIFIIKATVDVLQFKMVLKPFYNINCFFLEQKCISEQYKKVQTRIKNLYSGIIFVIKMSCALFLELPPIGIS
jgi:hypothetical protein